MFMDPKRGVFESVEDLVDYVDKGIIPMPSDYEKLISKVRNPDRVDDPNLQSKRGKEVIVTNQVVGDNSEVIERVLNRVYENRKSRLKKGCIFTVVGAAILGIGAYLLVPRFKKKEEPYDPFEDDYDEYDDYED